jgi:ribosome maturation factor RimP
MISATDIRKMVEEHIKDTPVFLVDMTVSAGNVIRIYVDNDEGPSINNCVEISRLVEGSLDRELEDFELHVSSPGLDQPLKVVRQYIKNVGRGLKVIDLQGKTVEGILESADESQIVVKTREKRRIEGRKAKEWVEELHPFNYDEIAGAKVVISFK